MHMFQSSEDMFSHMPFAQASIAKRYYTVSQIKKNKPQLLVITSENVNQLFGTVYSVQ